MRPSIAIDRNASYLVIEAIHETLVVDTLDPYRPAEAGNVRIRKRPFKFYFAAQVFTAN